MNLSTSKNTSFPQIKITTIQMFLFATSVLIGFVSFVVVEIVILFLFYIKPRECQKLPSKLTAKPPPLDGKRLMRELNVLDRYSEKESCSWLNVSLARVLFEVFEMESFRDRIKVMVQRRLVDLRRTRILGRFLASIELKDFYMVPRAPIIRNISVVRVTSEENGSVQPATPTSQSEDAALTLIFDLEYGGRLSLAVLADFLSRDSIKVGVTLNIKEIRGRLFVRFNPSSVSQQPSTISFAFLQSPEVRGEAMTRINGFSMEWLNLLSSWLVRSFLFRKITLPAFGTAWLGNRPPQPPYPGEVSDDKDLYTWCAPTLEQWLQQLSTSQQTQSNNGNSESTAGPDSKKTASMDNLSSLGSSSGSHNASASIKKIGASIMSKTLETASKLKQKYSSNGSGGSAGISGSNNNGTMAKQPSTEETLGHQFKVTTSVLSACAICRKRITSNQALKCQNCKLVIHEKCVVNPDNALSSGSTILLPCKFKNSSSTAVESGGKNPTQSPSSDSVHSPDEQSLSSSRTNNSKAEPLVSAEDEKLKLHHHTRNVSLP